MGHNSKSTILLIIEVFHNFAVEYTIHLLILFIELLSVHACSDLLGHISTIFDHTFSTTLNHKSKSINQSFLWVVEVWQCDWEIEDVNQLIRLVLDGLCQVDKVLIHDESFLGLLLVQCGESLQNLSNVRVVHSVDFNKIFQQHEHHI